MKPHLYKKYGQWQIHWKCGNYWTVDTPGTWDLAKKIAYNIYSVEMEGK